MPELVLPGRAVPGRALIFDKDGVLVDFHRFWGAICDARVAGVARRAGLSPEEAATLTRELGVDRGRVDPTGPLAVGTRLEEETVASAYLYRRGMTWLEARRLVEEEFDAAEAGLDWTVTVRPLGPLLDTFRRLRRQGWALAIATSDLTRNAARHAELLGIADLLGAIVGADSVGRSKPHPDLVLACCERLGIAPSETVVIGDTLADLLMARSAGSAAAIGVTSGVSEALSLAPHADAVLEGTWELPERSREGAPPAGPALSAQERYVLSTDGASRGNPGPAGLGVVLAREDGTVIREIAEPLGETTNNVAEYRALIRGLKEAERLGIRRLLVRSDSQLMIRQLQGSYAIRNEALLPLYHAVQELLRSFREVDLFHVERAQNTHADALANEGVSQNQGPSPWGG